MSKIEDLDLWIHLGDLIYEYGPEVYPSPKEAVRPAETLIPQHLLVTLQDYRQRHALYRQAHAAAARSAGCVSPRASQRLTLDALPPAAAGPTPPGRRWRQRRP